MSILAAVATFRDDPGAVASVETMLAALPGWAPDGVATRAAAGAALGLGKLLVGDVQGHAAGPLHDREAGLTLVADVRIDNRDELRALLDLPATATDAEVVLAGYRRFGAGLPARLVGDFAFVVWDERARVLFAARDAFAARPLVYRVLADRVLIASDVEQILAIDPTAREVDEASVVDYLLGRRRFDDRTFFVGIKQVAAGSALTARGPGAVAVARWWSAPAPEPVIADGEEALAEFRRVFARAVSDRLVGVGPRPGLVHLSGGFDSSVIALCASEVANGRPLRAVGAVHPGLACDESPFMKATAARLSYPFEPWDANRPDTDDFERPALAGPGARVPRSNGSVGDLAIARREGARVVLSGLGGDGLHPHWDLVADFMAAGAWTLVARATLLAEGSSWRFRQRLGREALKLLVPRGWRRRWRAWRWQRRDPAPAWLAADHHAHARAPVPEPEDLGPEVGPGGAARWHEWRRPLSLELMRNEQRAASEARTEYRCPFLDLRVAAVAARMPLSLWRPPRYDQRLHALAYAKTLPPEIRRRRKKTVFGAAVTHRLHAAAGPVERLLFGRPLRANRYLGASAVETMRTALAQSARETQGLATDPDRNETWQAAALTWKVAALEAWLGIV